MKNKFLSYGLAFCLAVPCALSLASCGESATPVSEEQWVAAFGSLANYSIIGGPSTNDPDYAEYYFEENGLRMYTPNNQVANRQDAYVQCDNGVWTKYTKLTAGGWSVEATDETFYQTTKAYVDQLYLNFVNSVESFVVTETGFKNTMEITGNVTGLAYTFHYYDILINLNEEGEITTATWKQKYTLGEASSYEYNMTLTAGNVSLTYPTANTLMNETDWNNAVTFANYAPVTLERKGGLTVKFDGTVMHVYQDYSDENVVYIDEYYFVKEGNTYYSLNRWDMGEGMSAWEKETLTETKYNNKITQYLGYGFTDKFSNYSLVSFDSNKLEYYAESYGVLYATITNARVWFVDGKCVKFYYETNGDPIEATLSYGPVEITVPKV